METILLSATDPNAIQRVTKILREGGIVAFPTDTVYGVGGHAFLPKAVARLYAVKRRPADLPIPLLLSTVHELHTVCTRIPRVAWHLAERFWPGALSLVLPRGPRVPLAVTAGGQTVAVRVPDHPLVRALGRELGVPLATSSANRHGYPAPSLASKVALELGGDIAAILDGGPSPGGVASTVLDLTQSPAVIRRPGPVTAAHLAAVVDLRV